jgi:hypothetical protein
MVHDRIRAVIGVTPTAKKKADRACSQHWIGPFSEACMKSKPSCVFRERIYVMSFLGANDIKVNVKKKVQNEFRHVGREKNQIFAG